MLKSIIGTKVGMTQVFDDKGNLVPVTVVEAGPCVVCAVKNVEKDGYNAVQLGFGAVREKSLNKPEKGMFAKVNVAPKKVLKEFIVEDPSTFSVGQEFKADVFKAGDYVDVSAFTKGKGFSGVIKRHNFEKQKVSHGQSDRVRARGSSGGQGPQKVLKGMRMAGQYGNEYVTIQKLLVVGVDVEKNALLIKGSVPAAKKGTLLINKTVKKVKAPKAEVKADKKGKKK